MRGGRKTYSWEERRLKAGEMEADVRETRRDGMRSTIFAQSEFRVTLTQTFSHAPDESTSKNSLKKVCNWMTGSALGWNKYRIITRNFKL